MPSSGTSSQAAAPISKAQVGVVIVSWNVRELLRRCLATLAESAVPLRVVVVDNASSDGSAAMLRAEFPQVTLIDNPDNAGFTRANNQGFGALGLSGIGGTRAGTMGVPNEIGSVSRDTRSMPEPRDPQFTPDPRDPRSTPKPPPLFTLILNPDTEVQGDAVRVLADYLDGHPGAAAVGPRLLNPDGSLQPSRRRFPTLATGLVESTPLAWHRPDSAIIRRYHMADVPADRAGPVDWVTGAAILFRTEALEAAGGFDEGFFMYSEELDLCRRLSDRGWTTDYCPDARIVHHEGQSSAQVSAARHLHFQRSRVRYFRKHHGRLAAAVVRTGILATFAGEMLIEAAKWLLGHKRALRRARVAAYWRLLRDGLPADGGA